MVVNDIFPSISVFFDGINVANRGVQRVWVCAPLDIARPSVRSLNLRPFFLSEL